MAGKNKKQESALRIRRVYDRPAQEEKSAVYLVDRLWPRGGLRHWFGHDPARWPAFKRRYFGELRLKPEVWRPLADLTSQTEQVRPFRSFKSQVPRVRCEV